MSAGIDPRFRDDIERLLADGDLLDLDPLLSYDGYFDELPLFATYAQIAFLDGLPPAERDRVLVRAAVAHLERILAHAAGHPDFFCAVTVTGWDEPLLVPRFWRANPSRGVFEYLRLSPPAGAAAVVAGLLGHDPDYVLHEDFLDGPGGRRLARVFVTHVDHPVPSA
ncbi:Imm15 family immunity protein [Amycolatopsis suaedae]|uniref:Uncharacterized protein n=1 Tax=Amycolatopsis suaedae TaxID=2510978 RepID=A0A4V2EMR0_9PSEU|nr:Imm15 family immunity protein [Amycolatopsis suaedae]RZQ65975.1 hypothetical protein EWH70_02595 [Amycolatopsis suaedae]